MSRDAFYIMLKDPDPFTTKCRLSQLKLNRGSTHTTDVALMVNCSQLMGKLSVHYFQNSADLLVVPRLLTNDRCSLSFKVMQLQICGVTLAGTLSFHDLVMIQILLFVFFWSEFEILVNFLSMLSRFILSKLTLTLYRMYPFPEHVCYYLQTAFVWNIAP